MWPQRSDGLRISNPYLYEDCGGRQKELYRLSWKLDPFPAPSTIDQRRRFGSETNVRRNCIRRCVEEIREKKSWLRDGKAKLEEFAQRLRSLTGKKHSRTRRRVNNGDNVDVDVDVDMDVNVRRRQRGGGGGGGDDDNRRLIRRAILATNDDDDDDNDNDNDENNDNDDYHFDQDDAEIDRINRLAMFGRRRSDFDQRQIHPDANRQSSNNSNNNNNNNGNCGGGLDPTVWSEKLQQWANSLQFAIQVIQREENLNLHITRLSAQLEMVERRMKEIDAEKEKWREKYCTLHKRRSAQLEAISCYQCGAVVLPFGCTELLE